MILQANHTYQLLHFITSTNDICFCFVFNSVKLTQKQSLKVGSLISPLLVTGIVKSPRTGRSMERPISSKQSMSQSAPTSRAKLNSILYGTTIGTSRTVMSFAFSEPGSGIFPFPISLSVFYHNDHQITLLLAFT